MKESGLQLITQPDHAGLAADILALWRANDLPRHPRREALIEAVREHDNGWRETDSAPRLDELDGNPVGFRRLPREERFALWRRALDRLADSPYAVALVALHALEIHRDRQAPDWEGFRAELRERREEARREAGLDEDELAADYQFLDLCDTISLAACGAVREARTRGHSIGTGADTVVVEPFPLAGATTFRIPVRFIPKGPYRDPGDLIGHLAAARWRWRPIRMVPAGP